MTEPTQQMIDFHKCRMQSHIDAVNYLGGLIGRHFFNHDEDKVSGPLASAYLWGEWEKYNPEFAMSRDMAELNKLSRNEHYRNASHHQEYYADISKMPDINIIEMICDGYAVNRELNLVSHTEGWPSLMDAFEKYILSKPNWTKQQRALILNTISELNQKFIADDFIKIFRPTLTALKSK